MQRHSIPLQLCTQGQVLVKIIICYTMLRCTYSNIIFNTFAIIQLVYNTVCNYDGLFLDFFFFFFLGGGGEGEGVCTLILVFEQRFSDIPFLYNLLHVKCLLISNCKIIPYYNGIWILYRQM